MGPSWGHLGPSWVILGPSWAHLGPSWAHLGPILGLSWAILGHLGDIWGPSSAILGHLPNLWPLAWPQHCWGISGPGKSPTLLRELPLKLLRTTSNLRPPNPQGPEQTRTKRTTNAPIRNGICRSAFNHTPASRSERPASKGGAAVLPPLGGFRLNKIAYRSYHAYTTAILYCKSNIRLYIGMQYYICTY